MAQEASEAVEAVFEVETLQEDKANEEQASGSGLAVAKVRFA